MKRISSYRILAICLSLIAGFSASGATASAANATLVPDAIVSLYGVFTAGSRCGSTVFYTSEGEAEIA